MPQQTPFDNILAQCRDLACERLTQALSSMLAKADQALTAMMQANRDPVAQKLLLVTRNKVVSQHDTIEKQFRMRFLKEFQERSNRVKKIGESFAAMDLSSLELELVAEEDLNETLKFNAMATKLRQYCDDELVALDQRVGVLIGDASLQAEDNPFTPQTICDAYKQTCKQIDSNVDVRMVLLKLFDDHVLDDIRAVYKDINALLVENAILPKIRVGGAQRARSTTEAEAEPKPAEDEKDIFSMLQKLMVKPAGSAAAAPAAGQGAGGPPGAAGQGAGGGQVLQGTDLLRSLTRIQLGDASGVSGASVPLTVVAGEPVTTNILHELKGTSVGSGMNQMDSMTLDIMAMLFDQLFDDPKIPGSVKGLIGRLQIPMLKVAIADKSFFSKKTHPARRMLDALGEIAARMPADVDATDEVYKRLEAILQELIDGFEDDLGIFDSIRERLESIVIEEDQRAQQETQASAKQIEQKEHLALAKTISQAELKIRVRASKAPRHVVEFLVQQWIKFLLVVHVRDGEGSEAWKSALETAELLLWSAEPKSTLEERQKLVSTVPGLLKKLTVGLEDAGVEEEARSEFFAELRRLYSDLLGKTQKPEVPAAPPAEPGEPEAGAVQPASAPEPAFVADATTEPAADKREEAAELSAASGAEAPSEPEPQAGQEDAKGIALDFAIPDLTVPAPKPAAAASAEDTKLPIDLPPLDFESLSIGLSAAPAPAASEKPPVVDNPPVAHQQSPPAPARTAPEKPPAEIIPSLAHEPSPPVPAPASPAGSPPPAGTARVQTPPAAVRQPSARSPAPPPQVAPPQAPPAQPAAAQRPAARPTPVPPRPAAPAQAAAPAAPPLAPIPAPLAGQARPAGPQHQAGAPVKAPAAQAGAAMDSLDFTAPVTVKNPFGGGEVLVDDLDFTQAAPKAASKGAVPKREDLAALPENLVVGSWIEIREKGTERKLAKLSFVTPLKTRYLFVNRRGNTILECSRAELSRRFQLGEITVTVEGHDAPLFDRIAEGVIGKLAGSK